RRAERVTADVDEPGRHALRDLVRARALQPRQQPTADDRGEPIRYRRARELRRRGQVEASTALLPQRKIVRGEDPGAFAHPSFISKTRPAARPSACRSSADTKTQPSDPS